MAKTLKGVIELDYKDPQGGMHRKTLAAPIVEEGRELTHPLVDYFPHGSPWLWFRQSAKEHRDYILGVIMRGACPIFGYPNPEARESVEIHHEFRRGFGGKIQAEAPWAMIPGLKSPEPGRSAHDLYHTRTLKNKGFTLVHWDFLDEEDGLIVLDENEAIIPHKDLWYYTRPTDERIKAAEKWLKGVLQIVRSYCQSVYFLGSLTAQGDEYARALGFRSVASCFAQYGIGNDVPQMMRLLFQERGAVYEDLEGACVIPEAADLWRRRTASKSEEEQEEWMHTLVAYCGLEQSQPSFQDFGRLIRGRFPPDARNRKITIVTGDADITETEHPNPEELVQAGQTVIAGHRIKAKEKQKTPTPLLDTPASA